MATILEFRASQEPSKPAHGRRKRRSAEIVIFPGVRYERWSDAPAAGQAPSATQRDTLTLVD